MPKFARPTHHLWPAYGKPQRKLLAPCSRWESFLLLILGGMPWCWLRKWTTFCNNGFRDRLTLWRYLQWKLWDYFRNKAHQPFCSKLGTRQGDYEREKARVLIYAFGSFWSCGSARSASVLSSLRSHTENNKQFRDVLLRNAQINSVMQDLAIQYTEVRRTIKFNGSNFGRSGSIKALKGAFGNGFGRPCLINSYENVFEWKNSTIWDKTQKIYKFQ